MTLKELLAQSTAQYGSSTALRYKQQDQWHTLTYSDLLTRAQQVSNALSELGIKPRDRVALYRENSPEWPEIYFGIVDLGAIAVPIDAKLKGQEIAHILRNSEARLLISGVKQYLLLSEIEGHTASLEHILLIDGREVLPAANSRKVKYHDYEEVLEHAKHEDNTYNKYEPTEEDVASIIYTSGTTGRQKGAMLTHGNFAANIQSCQQAIHILPSDHFLLVLPLHHALAFTASLLLPLACGCEISLVENLKTVGENMRELSPTVLIGVPLLLEKIYGRIWASLKASKFGYLLYGLGIRKPVIRKIAQKLGGQLRLIVTGGAPCDSDLLNAYTNLGIPVIEGYGLTETAPVLTLNPMECPKPGTVGKPLPNVDINILDPDEKGVGEVTAAGPNIMKGYYKNEEATSEAMIEGYFLTGDLGFIDEDNYLIITGRKKSLIVNREGKNIYPEEVETQIIKSPLIREVLALGYKEMGTRVGEQVGIIIVPDQDAIDALSKRHKKTYSEEEISNMLRDEVKNLTRNIAEYKRPRQIQIRWEEFAKTSTGKIKRYLYAMTSEEVD